MGAGAVAAVSWLRRGALWILGGGLALFLLVLFANAVLALALFGPGEGVQRLGADWRRILVAHQMTADGLTAEAAFRRLYGRELGPEPTAEAIRRHILRDLEDGEPAVLDAVMARYIEDRFGAIDGRTTPAGVYLAAGPIGPDRWPGPLVTHYLIFPRHGYLLVVPPQRQGRWAPAYEATASLRKAFRSGGDKDGLYAELQTYEPGAYDFPKPGEPVHDLLLISDDDTEVADIEARLRAFSERLDDRGLDYRLLRRNSNSTLACYLHVAGLAEAIGSKVGARLLLRLRLPGVAVNDRLPC